MCLLLQCVATVMMLAGVVFFGILIGSLGEIVQHASTRARQAQMFRRKFEDVEAWMRMRRLPKYTQKKIRYAAAEALKCMTPATLHHQARTSCLFAMCLQSRDSCCTQHVQIVVIKPNAGTNFKTQYATS